jgi:hypothetical protein
VSVCMYRLHAGRINACFREPLATASPPFARRNDEREATRVSVSCTVPTQPLARSGFYRVIVWNGFSGNRNPRSYDRLLKIKENTGHLENQTIYKPDAYDTTDRVTSTERTRSRPPEREAPARHPHVVQECGLGHQFSKLPSDPVIDDTVKANRGEWSKTSRRQPLEF